MNGQLDKRILGVDYGDKNIGLAIASSRSIAVPYKVIQNQGFNQVLTDLREIIKKEKIDLLIIGLPYSLSGRINKRLEITRKFINNLKDHLSLPISTVNEQFTSKLYTEMGIKQDIDKYAATAILDTWLAQQKND